MLGKKSCGVTSAADIFVTILYAVFVHHDLRFTYGLYIHVYRYMHIYIYIYIYIHLYFIVISSKQLILSLGLRLLFDIVA